MLFSDRPVTFERTGGSAGGDKLVPYSAVGLVDVCDSILPWLRALVRRYDIGGSAYFSISPATRLESALGGVPVGLPEGALLGEEAARVLVEVTAVPLELAVMTNLDRGRRVILRYLAAARDLELISVWSPTCLLRLPDEPPDPRTLWRTQGPRRAARRPPMHSWAPPRSDHVSVPIRADRCNPQYRA